MKQVFNSSELPHIWAQQRQQSGKGGSIFFEGQTIYSYGYHFPIATIKDDVVFFTTRSYSSTTAKHISKTRNAVSHKNLIFVHSVPVGNFDCLSSTHEENLNHWEKEIKNLFNELGNKKIRDTQSRINVISGIMGHIEAYCKYFKLTVGKELKKLIKLSQSPDFVQAAIEAKEKQNKATELKMKKATKVYDKYLFYWRNFQETEDVFTEQEKELIRFYYSSSQSFTRLRFNKDQNRVETSKGVQIPVEIAKRAFINLGDCLNSVCKNLSIDVLSYTITESGKDYIKAGCHTIPKEDVNYIAKVNGWL